MGRALAEVGRHATRFWSSPTWPRWPPTPATRSACARERVGRTRAGCRLDAERPGGRTGRHAVGPARTADGPPPRRGAPGGARGRRADRRADAEGPHHGHPVPLASSGARRGWRAGSPSGSSRRPIRPRHAPASNAERRPRRARTKYVFVTGGVSSSLGKGLTASSLGRLLKCRGLRVTMIKLDPYINVDPGTMNPFEHGEVFVTDDGGETDLDLGHYERFIDENLHRAPTPPPVDLLVGDRQGAAGRLPGQDRPGHPPRHRRDQEARSAGSAPTTSTWSSSRSAAPSATSRSSRSSRPSASSGRTSAGTTSATCT